VSGVGRHHVRLSRLTRRRLRNAVRRRVFDCPHVQHLDRARLIIVAGQRDLRR